MALQYSMGRFAKGKINKIVIEENTEEREVVEKFCYKCRDYFPSTVEYFYRNKDQSDGLCSECKKCNDVKVKKRKQRKRKDN